MKHRIGYWTAVLLLAAGAASAQTDPPLRVARMGFPHGATFFKEQVSFRPGSTGDWGVATLNYPLTAGDRLWTVGAQSELHVGSTAIRLGSRTMFGILNLDDRIVQLSLTAGSLNIHVRHLGPDEVFEVDTPNAAISLLRPGDYRFNVDGDKDLTVVTLRSGESEVTRGGAAFRIHPVQTASLSGEHPLAPHVGPALPADAFDRWCETRERREASTVAARFVSREMIGYEDLDEYGAWREIPPYGWVWAPTSVPRGWVPYLYGHWAWVEPWGWTWIDDAPWGFAPFHYGRWAFVGGAWVWVPGNMKVGVRPVYAPALVAFVEAAGAAVGGGAPAAWFPLAPGEVYRPNYHVSGAYVQQINAGHVADVTVADLGDSTSARYVNRGVAGAVIAAPHEAIVSGRPVNKVAVRLDARKIANARVTGTTAAVAPRRQSIIASELRAIAPPARFEKRPVVSKLAPPAPPVPFDAKRQALEANGGRPTPVR